MELLSAVVHEHTSISTQYLLRKLPLSPHAHCHFLIRTPAKVTDATVTYGCALLALPAWRVSRQGQLSTHASPHEWGKKLGVSWNRDDYPFCKSNSFAKRVSVAFDKATNQERHTTPQASLSARNLIMADPVDIPPKYDDAGGECRGWLLPALVLMSPPPPPLLTQTSDDWSNAELALFSRRPPLLELAMSGVGKCYQCRFATRKCLCTEKHHCSRTCKIWSK